jgi:sec-independent protein translocase protein TatC
MKRLFRSRSSATVEEAAAGLHGDGAPATLLPPHDQEFHLAEMSFLDHLEELRWSILKGLGALLLITIVCAFFSKWIIDVLLLGPAKASFFMYGLFGMQAEDLYLQNRTITGQFFAHVGTVVAVGLVIGSPLIVYYLWKFVEPGLYPSEKKGMRFAAVFATFFFILGILFGYLIITPLALQFFANYSISPQIVNEFDITKYFSMVTFWAFGVGVLFEMPVVIYFLAKIGLVTESLLRNSRKYALILVLVLGAFFTPPDPVSQVLVALPLLLLYELSIRLAGYVERKKERELREALK